jgi:hypothetical protein
VVHEIGTRGKVGHCVEAHDLAASKLAAYREKDREFVTAVLVEGRIRTDVLAERMRSLPVPPDLISKLEGWVRRTARELSGG